MINIERVEASKPLDASIEKGVFNSSRVNIMITDVYPSITTYSC